jgi:hypothetical protein
MTRRNPLVIRRTEPPTLASDADPTQLLYDYSQLPTELQAPLMLSARRIKTSGLRIRNDMIHIGRELTEAKARLPHGEFSNWLSTEFDMSDRSARRFMQIYTEFSDQPEAFSLLSGRALGVLADPDVPQEARDEAIETAKATGKSPTEKEARAMVKKYRPEPQPLSSDCAPSEPPPIIGITDEAHPAGVLDSYDEEPDDDDTWIDDTTEQEEYGQTWEEYEEVNFAAVVAAEVGAAAQRLSDSDDEPEPTPADRVTVEAHLWRAALLAINYNLAKLADWIADHNQPHHYPDLPATTIEVFHLAWANVVAEVNSKYGQYQEPLPIHTPPPQMPSDHNGKIDHFLNRLIAAHNLDMTEYGNLTGDFSTPNTLRRALEKMIRNLEDNRR